VGRESRNPLPSIELAQLRPTKTICALRSRRLRAECIRQMSSSCRGKLPSWLAFNSRSVVFALSPIGRALSESLAAVSE